MAVIREKRQFSVGPIGVARASSGGEEIGRGLSNLASTLGQISFDKQSKAAVKAGQEAGMTADRQNIITINPETGKPEAMNIPQGFGDIAASAYESVVLERFQNEIQEELRLKAKELAVKYDRDPNAFSQTMTDYIDSMAKNSGGMFEEYITNTGTSYLRSTQANLVAAKVARDRAAAANSILTTNISSAESIFDLAQAGDIDGALAAIEARTNSTKNGIDAGLLNVGADQAAKDELAVQAVAGSLQRMLKDATGVQSSAVSVYLMSQGEQGGNLLTEEQKAELDRLKPYITRENSTRVLTEYGRIQSGYDSIRNAQFEARKTELDAQAALDEAALRRMMVSADQMEEVVLSNMTNTISQAIIDNDSIGLELNILAADQKVLGQQADLEEKFVAGLADMTKTEMDEMVDGYRRAHLEAILLPALISGSEDQKNRVALALNGDGDAMAALNPTQQLVVNSLRESGYLYNRSSGDDDFVRQLASNSVDHLRQQADKQVAQANLLRRSDDVAANVERGIAAPSEIEQLRKDLASAVGDGQVNADFERTATRRLNVSMGKSLANMASNNATYLDMLALSNYIRTEGQETSGVSEMMRLAGDEILKTVSGDDRQAVISHVNSAAEKINAKEAETLAVREKAENRTRVAVGFGNANDKDDRVLVDKLLEEKGVSLYDPKTLGDANVYSLLSSAPSQRLVDGLSLGVSGTPPQGFDTLFQHWRNLSQLTNSEGVRIDRFGNSLSATDKQFLIDVGELSESAQISPSAAAAEIYRLRTDPRVKDAISLTLGDKTPREFVLNMDKDYSQVPEVEAVVEYWASRGKSSVQIKDHVEQYVDQIYGDKRSQDRFVYDPLYGRTGYTRGNLNIAFPDDGERTYFKQAVEDFLTPKGYSLFGAGGRTGQYTKAFLIPSADMPGEYLVGVERNGEIRTLVLEENGEMFMPQFGKDDTKPYRDEQAADLAEATRKEAKAEVARQTAIADANRITDAQRMTDDAQVRTIEKYYPED